MQRPNSHTLPFACLAQLACLALALTTLSPSAAAQELDAQVLEVLRGADQGRLDAVWRTGRHLGELGDDEEQLAGVIEKHVGKFKFKARLTAAVALQELADGTQFGNHILTAIEPVLKSKDVPAVEAALHIAQQDMFFSSRTRRKLRGIVKPFVTSDLTEPRIRVAAARALWRIGEDGEQAKAKSVLVDFVKSSDAKLKVMGALALADINADSSSPAWPVLMDIASEPTPEGRLARSYLRIENQRRTFDAALRDAFRGGDNKAAPKAAGKPAAKPAGKPTDKRGDFAVLEEVLERVESRHANGGELEKKKLIEYAAKGVLRSLDRHSTFLTSQEYQKFYFDLNPEYGGIGAFVDFDNDNDFAIVRPIYSGPAYRAALRSGDKILAVDEWPTKGKTSDEIIKKLKGKPGTPVTVKIFRRGWEEAKDISIVRRQIQVPSVNHEMLPGDVGYVEVVTFGGRTSRELVQALRELRQKGAKALVLDLRNNTGGYLEVAKEIVELFVAGRKMVVYTKGRKAPRQEYKTEDRAILPDIPLAVLVNEYSASASEITAGALQDHGRAVIVGKRSYGKGSVQGLIPLASDRPENYRDLNGNRQWDTGEPFEDRNDNDKYDIGPRIKLTIAHYYLPSGRCVHKRFDAKGNLVEKNWGVTPDKVLKLRDVPVKERWKEAVLYDLIEKDVFNKYVEQQMPKHKNVFLQLADKDAGSVADYPGFEEFYKGLDTKLSRDDIRRWVRYSVRDKVSDLRGKAYPGSRAYGDFQEDAQLQEAVRSVLGKLKTDIRSIQAYKNVLKIRFPAPSPGSSSRTKTK